MPLTIRLRLTRWANILPIPVQVSTRLILAEVNILPIPVQVSTRLILAEVNILPIPV
jgi:hypothetical protein